MEPAFLSVATDSGDDGRGICGECVGLFFSHVFTVGNILVFGPIVLLFKLLGRGSEDHAHDHDDRFS